MSSATTYKRHLAKMHTETKFPGSSLEMCLSVDVQSTISRKTRMGDREKICCPLTGWTSSLHMRHWCCSLVVGVKQTVPQNVLVCHKVYHAHMAADALIFVNTRIEESLYQKAIDKVTMRKNIKMWNHSLKKKVLIVGFCVLDHTINATTPHPFFCQIYRITPIKLILERLELQ